MHIYNSLEIKYEDESVMEVDEDSMELELKVKL